MQKLKAFFFIMSLGLGVVSTQATTVDTNAIMRERYSIKEPEKINIPPKKYLGEFLLTAYCIVVNVVGNGQVAHVLMKKCLKQIIQ